MYICYVDESGTSEIPGNTSHFILSGISIPIWHWRTSDGDVAAVLARYGLAGKEFHTAWILRNYLEQSRIPDFESMDWADQPSSISGTPTCSIFKRHARGRLIGRPKRTSLTPLPMYT